MFKKILIGLAILIALLLITAITVPLIFKDDIVAKVKTTINDKLTAKVNFGDFSVSILRSFPNLSFAMENLTVAGTDSFAHDTLANIKELYVVVDLMSVINGETIKIRSIKLNEPIIYAKVLPSGKANWDITKPDTTAIPTPDTAAAKFSIALKKYEIVNGNITYDDQSLGFYTELKKVNHKGSGDFTQDLFTLITKTEAEQLTVKYGGIAYLNKVKADIDFPIEMDMKNSKYTFKENKINLNDLILRFEGVIAMPDTTIQMDIKFDAEKSDFKNFLSLIPAIYASSFADLKASGKFALKGHAKGSYNAISMPGFGIEALIENGNFKYPDLPTGINNVQLNLKITNPDGNLDNTLVNMNKLHLEFGKEPFDARLLLKTPISDPDIDMAVKGKIDLAQITKIVPIEGTKLSGLINIDMAAKGRMSTIEKGNYEGFDAKGNLTASNINYSSKETPNPVSISTALMTFSPKNITLSNFNAKVGRSDFKANGTFDNYLAYALRGQPLKGSMQLNSNVVDVNELMGPETSTSSSSSSSTTGIIEVPGNIDFILSSSMQKVYYDNMEINNLNGSIVIRDKTVSFEKVTLNTLDGKVALDGSYNTKNSKVPAVDMKFGIQNMNIQKAFKTFNTVQKIAPIAERTSGTFSTTLNFRSDINSDMTPIMSSIQGDGLLNIVSATLSGSNLMNKLSDALKMNNLKSFTLKDVKIKFAIQNGRLIVDPFDMKTGLLNMNIGGSSGLDQTIDYKIKMKLPRNALGGAANQAIGGLMDKINKQGVNYNPSETINVNALVGGTTTNPTVKLSMEDLSNSVKNTIENVIDTKKKELEGKGREEAQKRAQQILAEAQKKADAVKAEAQKLADHTRQEGYAAADKLEKEATNPIAKVAAKKAADKLRKETDEKANKVIEEGNKKADNIMSSARQEADKALKG